MKRKLLIGILVVLGIAVTVLNPLITGILAIGIWIYLVMMVRKQKTSVFNDQKESKEIGWHSKRLKLLLIVAGFSFLISIVSAIVHNTLHGLSANKGSVYFLISIVALFVFIVATAGSMVIFLKVRQKNNIKSS
jgi:hypothetical protein